MVGKVTPDDISNCIWVDAGIVSYKLCDFGFDCENCPFDKAMGQRPELVFDSGTSRNMSVASSGMMNKEQTTSSSPASLAKLVAGFLATLTTTPLPDDRLYSSNHIWIKEVDKNQYRIGIDHYVAAFLSPPLLGSFEESGGGIVLPQDWSVSVRDAPFSWIILDNETAAINSPINMRILKNNSQLKRLPLLAIEDPYNSGWISEVEIEKRSAVRKIFLTSLEAKSSYGEHLSNMEHKLLELDKTSIGTTMMDGGRKNRNLKSIIGANEYVGLLKAMLSLKN